MGTFNTIKAEVIARMGGRTDISARVDIWLNDAFFELCLLPRFAFFELDKQDTSIATVAATRVYALTGITDLWHILDVRDHTNERLLRRSSVREFDKRVQTNVTGFPVEYARFGTDLELDPTPDGAYTLRIRYRKRPNELSAGNATGLSREWDEVLTTMTVAKGFEALEQWEKASAQRQLLEGLLAIREEPLRLEDADAELTIGVELEG